MKIKANLIALAFAFTIVAILPTTLADDPELVVGYRVMADDGSPQGNDNLVAIVVAHESVPDEKTSNTAESNDAAVEDEVVFDEDKQAAVADTGDASGFDESLPSAALTVTIREADFSRHYEDWALVMGLDDGSYGRAAAFVEEAPSYDPPAAVLAQAPDIYEFVAPPSNYHADGYDHPIASNSIGRRPMAANTVPTPSAPRANYSAMAGAALAVLVPLALLYHRMRGSESLRNRTRAAIYELLGADSGMTVNAMSAATGVGYTTVMYHVRRLMREGLVLESGEGHNRLFYRNGGHSTREERDLARIARDGDAMRLLDYISEHPWCYRAEVAASLGVSTTTVNWHLKKLLKAGLVVEERDGKNAFLSPAREKMGRLLQLSRAEMGRISPTTTADLGPAAAGSA